jgi:CheY-like chemotaxis protein
MDQNATTEETGIVLIDDDTLAHFLFKALMNLYAAGVPFETFMTPHEVINLIENDSFKAAALVLDINMPNMNGWEFLGELQKMNYSIPVYMLTSSNHSGDRKRVSEFNNVKGYFEKPLTPEHLTTIVDSHIKRRISD